VEIKEEQDSFPPMASHKILLPFPLQGSQYNSNFGQVLSCCRKKVVSKANKTEVPAMTIIANYFEEEAGSEWGRRE